jgi:hypothetical protein
MPSDPPPMSPLELLAAVTGVLESMGIPYVVTGSMASMYYGEMRTTNDVDIVADLRLDNVREFISCFPPNHYYVSEDAVLEAIRLREQFNIIRADAGLKADIIIPKNSPHDLLQLSRAKRVKPTEGVEARFAAAEDVILKKLWFYQMGGSDKHLRDIASIWKVHSSTLDMNYLQEWTRNLGVTSEWTLVLDHIAKANKGK